MAGSGVSRAEENRRMRQEKLREELSNKKLVFHVLDTTQKLADLGSPLDALEIQRLKAANEFRLKLINKYLPDEKDTNVTLTGSDGGPAELVITKRVITSN